MVAKLYHILLCAAALALVACNAYYYEDYTQTLNRFELKVANFVELDSIILRQDSLDVDLFYPDTIVNVSLKHDHRFRNYQPKDSTLLANSDSASATMVTLSVNRANSSANPLSFEFKMDIEYAATDYAGDDHIPYWSGVSTTRFYLDIFGCNDINCETAEKIVWHNGNYSNVLVLGPDDFKFSKKNFEQFCDGDCSDYTKEYSFNLKIDHPRIKLDADIQQGYIECREKVSSGNWG